MLFAKFPLMLLIGSAFLWLMVGEAQASRLNNSVMQTELTPSAIEPATSEQGTDTAEPILTPQPAGVKDVIPTSQPSVISSTVTVTSTLTSTVTLTATFTPTITTTATITPTATPTPSPSPFPGALFPIMMGPDADTPFQPERILACQAPSQAIPDDDSNGISETIVLEDIRFIHDLNLYLRINHPWVGDLSATLTHLESGKSVELFNRPGIQSNSQGCGQPDIGAILDDEITLPVKNQCSTGSTAIAGIFQPDQALVNFNGDRLAGNWILKVVDNYKHDAGRLDKWCLVSEVGSVPDPTPTPEPKSIPPTARITNINSFPQKYPLDCESRVAVDWAAYYGYHINETTFFNDLPHSDNPDAGFVGNVFDLWGQIPPHSYGVHAEPVAALLRAFGVPAYAHRPLNWDDLRWEISQGQPVYVWTIGNSSTNQIPVYYTPNDGNTTIVAHYEHTVMVIGYNEANVTILDNGEIYTRSIQQFLSSWSALDNMALLSHP
jgi:uncharacterized protein YvpB/subtilisin-like proprotein convertase family protein